MWHHLSSRSVLKLFKLLSLARLCHAVFYQHLVFWHFLNWYRDCLGCIEKREKQKLGLLSAAEAM